MSGAVVESIAEVQPESELYATDIARLENMSVRWAQKHMRAGAFGAVFAPNAKIRKVTGAGYLAYRERHTVTVPAQGA